MLRLSLPVILIRKSDGLTQFYAVSGNRPLSPAELQSRGYNVRLRFTRWFGIGGLHLCGGFLYVAHWNDANKGVPVTQLLKVVSFFKALRKATSENANSWDRFLTRWKPVTNHLVNNAPFDGCMFETYGEELKAVQAEVDERKVWTLMDCDGTYVITNGYWRVNRIGYFIAASPCSLEAGSVEFTLADQEEEVESE